MESGMFYFPLKTFNTNGSRQTEPRHGKIELPVFSTHSMSSSPRTRLRKTSCTNLPASPNKPAPPTQPPSKHTWAGGWATLPKSHPSHTIPSSPVCDLAQKPLQHNVSVATRVHIAEPAGLREPTMGQWVLANKCLLWR